MISPEEAEELRKAANTELAKGKSREDVMREMTEVGYSEDDIKEILSKPEESEQLEPPKPEETEAPEDVVKEAMQQETTEDPPEEVEKKGGSKKKVAVAALVVVAIVVAVAYFFFLNYL